MDVLLRCKIPDVPGMLATLAGAIGEAGGDIEAVEVIETTERFAYDDLWVTTNNLSEIVAHIGQLEGVSLIHAGVSRGLPGDATARLAAGIDALMSGAMPPEDGLATLIGGLLQATSAEILGPDERPVPKDRRVLTLDVAGGVLVVRREYKFLQAEVQRAQQVLHVCERAAAIGSGSAGVGL